MSRKLFVCILTGMAVFGVTGMANAGGGEASGFIVHGIPGEEGFPVDISVDGECALPGFTFSNIVGPVPIMEGTRSIAISIANEMNPCGNAPELSAKLDFSAGVNYSIVAYLDADGNPTAGLFENDLSATTPGRARLIVQHTAAAPSVDVTVQRGGPNSPAIVVQDFMNGDQVAAEVRPGDWNVSLAPAGSGDPVFGPVPVELEPFTAYLIYAVGSLEGGSFTLLVEPVGDLKP